jgi:hypothetical protein
VSAEAASERVIAASDLPPDMGWDVANYRRPAPEI